MSTPDAEQHRLQDVARRWSSEAEQGSRAPQPPAKGGAETLPAPIRIARADDGDDAGPGDSGGCRSEMSVRSWRELVNSRSVPIFPAANLHEKPARIKRKKAQKKASTA